MKKLNPEALEKMAKEKNIDKEKIEKIADNYKGKSETELMDELIKIGQTLKGRDEVVSKFKAFLDEEQQNKLDTIMKKISDAEIENKINSKKTKSTKSSSQKTTKKTKTSKSSSDETISKPVVTTKKVKKVKKTKKP